MNIIIPLCGKGERFSKTHRVPKPLIKIFEKELLFYILDNIVSAAAAQNDIYIIINKNTLDVENIVLQKYPHVNIINIVDETRGAAETILIGLSKIKNLRYNNLLVVDGDNYYTTNFIKLIDVSYNSIFYFNDNSELPQYSYIELLDNNSVVDIKEKVKISNNANTGAYYFNNLNDFINACNYVIENNIRFKNEFYVSVIIDYMLKSLEKNFKGINIKRENYISLGTPELVDKYLKSTHAFLFDLDGTLIVSDHIYIRAWDAIFDNYGIVMKTDFYNLHIKGNSDEQVVNKLIEYNSTLKINVDEISKLKDSFFNEHINEIIIIENSIEFIKNVKLLGHKTAIVTNCNRSVAENVIRYLKLDNYIDFLVIGGEYGKPKPYPDPYINAINFFNITNKNCFIFEDSKSGLLSAKATTPKAIIGLDYYNNNRYNLLQNGANFTINDYYDENLLNYILDGNYYDINCNLKQYIHNTLIKYYDVYQIIIHNNSLKGGYISDVLKIDVILNDTSVLNMVLKRENKNTNCLSNMVDNLKLYEREYYLYETIYPHLNINVPKYYGTVRNEKCETIGILLENLNTSDYVLNLDMAEAKIDTILVYIETIAHMHNKFSDQTLLNQFDELYCQNSEKLNNVFICNFIRDNLDFFIEKWRFLLDDYTISLLHLINEKYSKIQQKLSEGKLTLCHGDFKSPNIFYNLKHNTISVIDWQYICKGKGIQDIVFFMIESFNSETIHKYFNIIVDYYKISGGFCSEEDITLSICYFPMLVTIWFGTINSDDLIDKNFPLIFIKKFVFFLNNYVDKNILISLTS